MKKDMKFQKALVKKLRSGKEGVYEEASMYTVLLDLVQDSDVLEVFMALHNVACDVGKRKKLEAKFEAIRKWKW